MGLAEFFSLRWELARFHTRESWLQWFAAVWGACLAAASVNEELSPLFILKTLAGNVLCMTLIHGGACTWNDVIDKDIDAKVERTKNRPLPSGRISVPGAILSSVFLIALSDVATRYILGPTPTYYSWGITILYFFYPFAKRYLPWPQMVLAPACGWPAFVGWTSIEGHDGNLDRCIPLFLAVSVWTIYFDTAYGSQDAMDDKKIGVKSLAVWIGEHIHRCLAFLGTLVIGLLSLSAYRSNVSLVFWVFGIAVWAVTIPYNLKCLDLSDRNSGGRVFRQNISLGGYVSLVAVAELAVQTMLKTRPGY